MNISTKISKILSAGKIVTASLLGVNSTDIQAYPTGNVQTYPTDASYRSTGNMVVWHPLYDRSLTVSLWGTAGAEYMVLYRIVDIATNEVMVGFTPFLQGFFPSTGRESIVIDDLDLHDLAGHKIQVFVVYENIFGEVSMSEVDNICISYFSSVCTGS